MGVYKEGNGDGMPGAFPFKAVIFDMDGVLVDTEVYYLDCRGQFLAESGVEVSHEELLELVGASMKQDRANMLKWFTRSGISIDAEGIETLEGAWWQGRDIDYATLLNPGVKETLVELKRRGVRLALASSSSHRNIAQVLSDCGLGGFFEVIISGEQFHESKPNPEIYLHTLESPGLSAGDCCCVEDSIPGIEAGRAAGLTVIAKREERFGFTQDAANAIIDSIPDVLDLSDSSCG